MLPLSFHISLEPPFPSPPPMMTFENKWESLREIKECGEFIIYLLCSETFANYPTCIWTIDGFPYSLGCEVDNVNLAQGHEYASHELPHHRRLSVSGNEVCSGGQYQSTNKSGFDTQAKQNMYFNTRGEDTGRNRDDK